MYLLSDYLHVRSVCLFVKITETIRQIFMKCVGAVVTQAEEEIGTFLGQIR